MSQWGVLDPNTLLPNGFRRVLAEFFPAFFSPCKLLITNVKRLWGTNSDHCMWSEGLGHQKPCQTLKPHPPRWQASESRHSADRRGLPSGTCSISQSCFAQKWILWQRLRVFPVPFSPSKAPVKENCCQQGVPLHLFFPPIWGRKALSQARQAGRKGYREGIVQLGEQSWCFSSNAEAPGLVSWPSGRLHWMSSPSDTGQETGACTEPNGAQSTRLYSFHFAVRRGWVGNLKIYP